MSKGMVQGQDFQGNWLRRNGVSGGYGLKGTLQKMGQAGESARTAQRGSTEGVIWEVLQYRQLRTSSSRGPAHSSMAAFYIQPVKGVLSLFAFSFTLFNL